jgi:outer membrane protein
MTIVEKMKKISVFTLAAFLLLGVISLITVQPGKVYAATAAPAVGVVDTGLLLDKHPDTQQANEILKSETEQAKKEFNEKSATLSDKDKQALDLQLTQRVAQKRQELLKAITDKINVAIKEVAEAKGLTIVIPKSFVIYGGQDITDDVLKKITGK